MTVVVVMGKNAWEGVKSGTRVIPVVGVIGLVAVAESCGLVVWVGKNGSEVRVAFEGWQALRIKNRVVAGSRGIARLNQPVSLMINFTGGGACSKKMCSCLSRSASRR